VVELGLVAVQEQVVDAEEEDHPDEAMGIASNRAGRRRALPWLSMENRTRGVKRWDEGCGVESWAGVDKTWVCGSF
jgi:hypothetical protein